jgi:hypothetical protein
MRPVLIFCLVSTANSLSESRDGDRPAAPRVALSYASPAALDAMRHFFSAHTSPELWKDKSLMALVQGKPATAQDPPPQTLAPFIPPFTPPDIPTVAAWSDYNMNMVGFWYRFKYGFGVFRVRAHSVAHARAPLRCVHRPGTRHPSVHERARAARADSVQSGRPVA